MQYRWLLLNVIVMLVISALLLGCEETEHANARTQRALEQDFPGCQVKEYGRWITKGNGPNGTIIMIVCPPRYNTRTILSPEKISKHTTNIAVVTVIEEIR